MSKRNLLLLTDPFSGFHANFTWSKLCGYFQIFPIQKKNKILDFKWFERCHLGMLGLNLGSTREVTRPGMGWSPVPALWAIASFWSWKNIDKKKTPCKFSNCNYVKQYYIASVHICYVLLSIKIPKSGWYEMFKFPVPTFQVLQHLLLSSRRISLPPPKKNLSLRIDNGGSIWPFSVELLSKQNMLGKCFWKDTTRGTMTPNLLNSKLLMFFVYNFPVSKVEGALDLQNLHQATDWEGPSRRHGGVPGLEPSRKGRCGRKPHISCLVFGLFTIWK